MTINREHLAGLELAREEINHWPVTGLAAAKLKLDQLIAQAQAAPEAEPYGYLREVDGNIQLSIGPVRPADRSGGFATPWAAIFAAPQHDAELIDLIGQLVSLAAITDEDTACSIADRIDAKLATLRHV